MCNDLEVSSYSGRSIRDKVFNGRPEISDESFMCEMSYGGIIMCMRDKGIRVYNIIVGMYDINFVYEI